MTVEPIYQLKISAENFRMSFGIFWFLMSCLAVSIAFITFKMLIPTLANRPLPFASLSISAGLIIFLFFLGANFVVQFNRKDPLTIALYSDGVQFEDSVSLVPYNEIQVSRGSMEGLNLTEGAATSIPLGQALVFKINHFDRYFKISFLKRLSPQYSDQNTYKVQIGDKGLTESQVTEFLETFRRLSHSN